jgi:CHAT domain-containing protein
MITDHCLSQTYVHLRQGLKFIAVLAIGSTVAGCESGGGRPVVSLDEAREITAEFGPESSFVAPPRTITDVLAALEAYSGEKSEALEDLRNRADLSPDLATTDEDRARIYRWRAKAAELLGRYEQAIADAEKALELDPGETRGVYAILAPAYDELGDHERALISARRFVESPETHGVITQGFLAMMLATIGDFNGAESALSSAKSALPAVTKWTGRGAHWVPFMRAFVPLAEGTVAYFRGEYRQAEGHFRESLRITEADITTGIDGRSIVSTWTGGTLQEARLQVKTYLLSWMGRSLARQGRLAEAETAAREGVVLRARNFGTDSGENAEALSALAEVLAEQGRFGDAATIARRAVDVYDKMGAESHSVTRALAARSLVDAYVGQERWSDAMAVYDQIGEGLAEDPEGLIRLLQGNLTWSMAMIREGRGEEAVRRLRDVRARLANLVGEDRYETAEATGLLATALATKGDREAAVSAFSKAIPTLLSPSSRSDSDDSTGTARQIRLQFILESYVELLVPRGKTVDSSVETAKAVGEAFRVAQAARGGTVQRALGASAARAAARDPDLADLARREQDALQQIGALNGLLARASVGHEGATRRQNLLSRITTLQAARNAIMAEIEGRFPEYAQLIDPQPLTVVEAQGYLRPGEALVSVYVGGDRGYVWAVPQAGRPAFAAVDLGREDLAEMVAALRGALDPRARTLGDIPEYDLATAYRLYERLLKPVEARWKQADSLLVVAHGALGYLPLSVLPTERVTLGPEKAPLFSNYRDVPWLARSHAVTVLPSVASLRTLRSSPAGDRTRQPLVAFADPVFNARQAAEAAAPGAATQVGDAGSVTAVRGARLHLRAGPETRSLNSAQLAMLPRLPDTGDEVRSMAAALEADPSNLFLGAEANEDRVKTMDLSGFKVLAFATHGLVPGDLDGLTQPALALSSPAVSGTRGDGLLTMGEILGLRLDAEWVVLSACNTGSSQGAGAEPVSGLGRAFFYAGSRALLVSNWPVHSASAKDLTTDLFRGQAADSGLDRAEALRRAMVGLIDGDGDVDARGRNAFSYAHPLFWAPFTLVGDGGGRPAS